MTRATVGVGVVGTGFGARTVAPAFAAVDGCRVVDVVSARDERAVAALCRRQGVDLVAVHSPPFLHRRHVELAAEAGRAVLCDKPFGRRIADAVAMADAVRAAGVAAVVNFELRFDPLRRWLHTAVRHGELGVVDHIRLVQTLAIWRRPLRPHGWLFDRDLGGGWLRAMGSHDVDFVRWCLGDVVVAAGAVRTAVPERPDGEGTLRRCTADDGYAVVLRGGGATASLDGTAVATVHRPPTVVVSGDRALAEVTDDLRLVVRGADGDGPPIAWPTPPGALEPAMAAQAAAVVAMVRGEDPAPELVTFDDAVGTVAVLDAVLAASGQGRGEAAGDRGRAEAAGDRPVADAVDASGGRHPAGAVGAEKGRP